ncbi:GNAT family N-acetyltransferase [Chitinophagaceae bacterium LWZ2-11]
MSEIIIRRAVREDLPQMLDIYNDVIINTTAVYNYQPHTLEMRTAWFEDKAKANHPVFVAAIGDVIAGFSSYGPFRQWAAYKYTIENSVYVHKDQRGKGIARKLMQPLIDDAIKQEYHAMVAGIDATNEASIQLHKSFGFEEVAHFKQVGYKFGKWLDLKFLELVFETPKEPREV